jgi:hypothetical protein
MSELLPTVLARHGVGQTALGLAIAAYDPSVDSACWQDLAGTIPAGRNDPVRRLDDLTGNGHHRTAVGGSAPPVRRFADGVWYIDHTNSDVVLQTDAVFDPDPSWEIFAAARFNTDPDINTRAGFFLWLDDSNAVGLVGKENDEFTVLIEGGALADPVARSLGGWGTAGVILDEFNLWRLSHLPGSLTGQANQAAVDSSLTLWPSGDQAPASWRFSFSDKGGSPVDDLCQEAASLLVNQALDEEQIALCWAWVDRVLTGYPAIVPPMPEVMIEWHAPASTAIGSLMSPSGTNTGTGAFAAIAPNGKIYAPPWFGSAHAVIWELSNNTVSSTDFGLDFLESAAFSGMQGGQYGGATLASDGKIYCPPWGEDRFLVIDPSNDTAIKTDFGQSIGAYDPNRLGVGITGIDAHSYGLVEGPNRKLYSIPYGLNRPPVIIDLDTQTAVLASYANIKSGGAFTKFELWNGGALAPNGKIYCSPYQRADEVLVIDTSNDSATLETFGLTLTGSYQFGQPVLGPDGKIYMPPYSRNACLVIDPATETATLEDWGLDLSEAYKYYSATVGPDGKIYCPPSFATTGWLVIDPIANTASFEDLSGSYTGNTALMAADGSLYHLDGGSPGVVPVSDYIRVVVSGAAGPAVPGFADDVFTIWHPR